MDGYVLTVGKSRYAAGLLWQAISRPREHAKEARELAKQLKVDLLVLRQGRGIAQVGLAATREGFASGALSIAALLADYIAREGVQVYGETTHPQNYLAYIQVGQAEWNYVAVRDGHILPQGDVVGSLDDVINKIEQTIGTGGYEAVIGSEELDNVSYDNFARLSFETLHEYALKHSKLSKKAALKPASIRINPRLLAIIVAASVVLLAGAYGIQRKVAADREAAEAADLARLQAQTKVQVSAQDDTITIPAPKSWGDIPAADSMILACVRALDDVVLGGWRLASFTCDTAGTEAQWKRGVGTAATFLSLRPTAVLSTDGNGATLKAPLQLVASGEPEELDQWESVRAQMISALQALNIAYTMPEKGEDPQPPAAPERSGKKVVYQRADWKVYTFKIGPTQVAPAELLNVINEPGLRLTKSVFADGKWTLEGSVYAK